MAEISLSALLIENFAPAACRGLELRVTFQWPDDSFAFAIREQKLWFEPASCSEPEMVIYTSSKQQLVDLLQGRLKPLDAFLAGNLRSNGYLMWVFQVLAAVSRQP